MIVLPQLFMLFAIACVGVLLRKKGVMGDPVVKGISDLVTFGTNPALLIMVTQHEYTGATLAGFLHVMWMAAAIMALVMILVYAACRRESERVRPILAMLSALPNAGFMGLPIIEAVYGDLGALYLAAVIVAFNLVVWTVGIALLDCGSLSWRKFINPGFMASLIGMGLFLLRVDLPDLLSAPIDALGSMNTPLAMLILGARMTGFVPRALWDWKNALVSAVKLVLMPLAALALAQALNLNAVAAGTLVLSSAMPSAIMGQMLAELYDRDALFAAQEVSFTSILCVVTIPLVVTLLGF